MSRQNDINALFDQMLTHWEDITNDMSANFMETEQFGQAQKSTMAMTLKMHEAIHKQMTRSLKIANMPSRDEVNELHGAVSELSRRMGNIERLLEKVVAHQSGQTPTAVKGPPRTKKPQKNKDKKAGKDG